jgi:uncharacterized membrane protein
MNTPLALAFLFFAGALLGYGIEFLFRNLISHSGPKGKYFINPGFCKGPYLPIYGVGLTVMFIITYLVDLKFDNPSAIVVIICITLAMTLIEFVGGVFLLKVMNLRLWDYRDRVGNIMGVICPLFSFFWGVIGAIYYLFIHPMAIDGIIWLSNNLAFSFFVGFFYGIFIIDDFVSTKDALAIKHFGDENGIVVKYEELKDLLTKKRIEAEKKIKFFNQAAIENMPLVETLAKYTEILENKADIFKSRRKKK